MQDTLSMGPVILDINGLHLTEEDKEVILHPLVGGLIFFKRNYESPEQLINLVNEIRAIRPQLLLCVDQEGGRVQRFTKELTKLPAIRSLSEAPQAERLSQHLGQLMALEVRALGVDLSFAPVLDLDRGMSEVIGDRAFHSDPNIVSALAKAYIQGMANVGMQAVGKHFPGHGAVVLDSHHALPIDDRPMMAIQEDMIPFRYLSQHGMAGVMPAHIIYPQVDSLPVGFSKYWLQTILREQLGFKGTIVSDDLSMEGAAAIGDYLQRAHSALSAGCDFVLVCNHRTEAEFILDNLKWTSSALNAYNRLNLLAKGASPTWEELKQSKIWLASSQAALELGLKTA